MAWHIASGPQELRTSGYDGILWRYELRDDAGEEAGLIIGVSGTALASESVSPETAEAIATRGRSALDHILNWEQPPTRVEFFSEGTPKYTGGRRRSPSADDEAMLDAILADIGQRGGEVALDEEEGRWRATVEPYEWEEFGETRLEAAERALERLAVEEIRLSFIEKGYALVLHQPAGGDQGWFAPFMKINSQGGSGPYGWGRTRLEAAQNAEAQLAAHDEG